MNNIHKDTIEELEDEFFNEDDGLVNIGKYDHQRLIDFILEHFTDNRLLKDKLQE